MFESMVDVSSVRRAWSLLLGLMFTIAGSTHAQPRHFVVGSKVRILAADSVDQNRSPIGARRELIGVVASTAGDTLVLRGKDAQNQRSIAMSRITDADEWTGNRTHMTAGALIGAAAGVGIGLLAVHSGGGTCSGDCDGILAQSVVRPAQGAVVAALGGVGMLVGTLIGAIPGDQWRPMSDERVGAAIIPTRRGVGVSLSLHW